jgi:hypothetical protein
MCQRITLVAFVAALTAAVGPSADARAEPAAPSASTTAHATMHTKLGRYSATISATRPARGKRATLAVHLSRGNPARDEQTHDYTFTLPRSAVAVDSRLGRARIKAKLGSLGALDLKLTGTGKRASQGPPAGCRGPATVSRSARARGSMRIRLAGLGTLRRAGRSVTLDRTRGRGDIICPGLKCRRYAGSEIVGVNFEDSYLSVQSDGLGHTFVFASVAELLTSPPVSIHHTRFALGGRMTVNEVAGPDDLSIELSGRGPAKGNLTFSGTGAVEPEPGCKGHSVRRIFGAVTGQFALQVDGVGSVSVSGDGSAAAPVAAYREQVE